MHFLKILPTFLLDTNCSAYYRIYRNVAVFIKLAMSTIMANPSTFVTMVQQLLESFPKRRYQWKLDFLSTNERFVFALSKPHGEVVSRFITFRRIDNVEKKLRFYGDNEFVIE